PLAIGSAWVLSHVERSAANQSDVVVEVLPGWTSVEIGDALQHAGVIDSSTEFQQVAASSNFTAFTAGRYVFLPDSAAREALDTLRGGPARIVPDLKLLIPPGLTLAGVAQRVGQLPGKSAERFLDEARSGNIRSRYEPAGVGSLEGLTWPDTYFIGANETEAQILQRLVDEFDKRADAIGVGNADATGLSPYQVIVAASLIQTESGRSEDSPKISAVIRNRLALGMMLQIDATLCYAKGGCPPVPVDADRKIDSPYNTYKVPGLPPTPIAGVSEDALKAALNPSADPYLFYVSDKNGDTYFATTQAEHDKNVQKARNVG
ncbi:MAG TPA: endolytic transglycosylase MltG, partial [Acidimicrobiia bacterium]|nr:endolytic transglycosylase MltG [Acidimicrobiia bacterium]